MKKMKSLDFLNNFLPSGFSTLQMMLVTSAIMGVMSLNLVRHRNTLKSEEVIRMRGQANGFLDLMQDILQNPAICTETFKDIIPVSTTGGVLVPAIKLRPSPTFLTASYWDTTTNPLPSFEKYELKEILIPDQLPGNPLVENWEQISGNDGWVYLKFTLLLTSTNPGTEVIRVMPLRAIVLDGDPANSASGRQIVSCTGDLGKISQAGTSVASNLWEESTLTPGQIYRPGPGSTVVVGSNSPAAAPLHVHGTFLVDENYDSNVLASLDCTADELGALAFMRDSAPAANHFLGICKSDGLGNFQMTATPALTPFPDPMTSYGSVSYPESPIFTTQFDNIPTQYGIGYVPGPGALHVLRFMAYVTCQNYTGVLGRPYPFVEVQSFGNCSSPWSNLCNITYKCIGFDFGT